MVGGVDLDDLPDPRAAREALDRVGFVVSLEIRQSSVTEHADVVLPVAPVVEKAGTYVDWEGRSRPFEATLRSTGALTDGRVLHALADELDVELGLPTVEATRAELARVGTTRRPRSADPLVAAGRREPAVPDSRPGRAGHLAAAARPRLAAGRRAAPGRHGEGRRSPCCPRPPRPSWAWPTAPR